MNIELGISGCMLTVVDGFMRKTSPDPAYHSRIQTQAQKQACYSVTYKHHPYIRVPQVLNVYSDGFDMEYVPALGYVEFAETASVEEMQNFIYHIVGLVFEWCSASFASEDASPYVDATIRKAMEFEYTPDVVKHELGKYRARPVLVPVGHSHGDLTMSNILFKRDSIYLVDWLDRTPSSFMFDVIKLRQDAVWDWTSANTARKHDTGKLILVDRMLNTAIDEVFASYISTDPFTILEMANYLSIMRYAYAHPKLMALATAAFLESIGEVL